MDAIDAIRTRRSIRHFDARSIDREHIELLLADASHAPWTPISAPRPWAFTVIEGREQVADFGARALAYARAHRPRREGYNWLDDPDFSVFHGAPAVVLISGKQANPTALEECTRAGMLLLVAAHARGLGGCWVGSPNIWLAEPAHWRELQTPVGYAPMATIALGYAASIPPAPRPFALSINWL